jgi:hypothetical protein
MIEIAIVNQSTLLTDKEVSAAVPALQRQVSEDFLPVWGIDARLQFVPKSKKAPADLWWMVLLDDSDQQGALGYHELTDAGLPLGRVFAKTDRDNGLSWTVTTSHELLEMLADPDINLGATVESNAGVTKLYAYEVCDPVEADQLGYEIDKVLVSNFVTPAWFESFREKGSTSFDHGSVLHEPFALAAGGYCSVLDIGGGQWQQITAEGAPARNVSVLPGSRRARRRLSRHDWRVSASG